MEFTYKVRGADGGEYGPVTSEQLTGWLREGRINGQTEVMRSDVDYWSRASSYTELTPSIQAAATRPLPSATGVATASTSPAAEAQMNAGASWFYWIAGLSLINSVVALSGSQWNFVLGLGITQIIDALGQSLGGAGKAVVLMLDLVVAGVFILFGVFSHKRRTWAFVTGMVCYGLDGLIFLLEPDWLALAFHGFALYCLFRGFKACRELNAA